MQNLAAVYCRSVTKIYRSGNTEVQALRGVDLEIRMGELMMLMGPSGCGKTTLISILAGILDRTSGECTVLGHDMKRMSSRQKTRFRSDRVGFVFQAFNLVPTLTAAENVAIPLLINKVPMKRALDAATDILESVGLSNRVSSLPSQLSGGEQQRVAIARAIVHNPQLIVCDEPTSSLDHKTGQSVMEVLRRHAVGSDRLLIVVTHDSRILGFADRIAQMEDGRIVDITSPPAQ